ncbi:MAG TPA: hypothetical protein VFM54_23420 [Micromonosporaceae bacterium]|nr:hypothetical protein [Micromonosporaceae bacterium]
MEARAHALAGDARLCARAMSRAEQALDKVRAEDEPFWIRFFTPAQLQAEFAYAAADLRRPNQVRFFAVPVLAATGEMERRRILVTTTLASSYLEPTASGPDQCDIDHACATLTQTVPLVEVVTSKRGITAVNQVRRRLAPYQDRQPVRELEAAFRPLIGAAA